MKRLTRDQLDEQMRAIDLWRQGRSIHEIAHELRANTYRVEKWLHAWGEVVRCQTCDIILEPYDPANIEQQCWQNGTRDGVHCTRCEGHVDSGGGWLGHTPLMESQEAITEINTRYT